MMRMKTMMRRTKMTEKYSRKQEIEDLGYERYNITISDMGKYLVVVREQWYDPKTGTFCGSSSLINKAGKL